MATYRLYEVTGHYDDGTYGAEHIGTGPYPYHVTNSPRSTLIIWTVERNGELVDLDIEANRDLDIVADGQVVATWCEVTNSKTGE